MHPRAAELVSTLSLAPHPEGGAFREVFRAARRVALADGTVRVAATHIYFLLVAGEHSRWHRVAHDEVWSWYEGDPLTLEWIAPDWSRIERRSLATAMPGHEPQAVVPAGCWQSARTTGAFTLVGCTVAPGFDFADFTLMTADPDAAARLERRFPEAARFLRPAER